MIRIIEIIASIHLGLISAWCSARGLIISFNPVTTQEMSSADICISKVVRKGGPGEMVCVCPLRPEVCLGACQAKPEGLGEGRRPEQRLAHAWILYGEAGVGRGLIGS